MITATNNHDKILDDRLYRIREIYCEAKHEKNEGLLDCFTVFHLKVWIWKVDKNILSIFG